LQTSSIMSTVWVQLAAAQPEEEEETRPNRSLDINKLPGTCIIYS
jgi:hypothetical protein